MLPYNTIHTKTVLNSKHEKEVNILSFFQYI